MFYRIEASAYQSVDISLPLDRPSRKTLSLGTSTLGASGASCYSAPMPRLIAFLLLVAVLVPISSQGQDELEPLQRALNEDPSDHRARCRLAFALVRAGRFGEAKDAASPAVAALSQETGRSARRLLGACLYNRGRAHEGLEDRAAARSDYVRSLAARSSDAVLARLNSLLPATDSSIPSPLPHAALAIAASGIMDEDAEVFAESAQSGDSSWTLVTVGPGGYRNGTASAFAVTEACGGLHVVSIDSVTYDNSTHLELRENSPLRFGRTDALVVDLEGGGDDNCGTMEGMAEYAHRATSVVFVEGCRLRVARFETTREDCGGQGSLNVRFDARGNAIVTDVQGNGTPPAGRHSLRQVALPPR